MRHFRAFAALFFGITFLFALVSGDGSNAQSGLVRADLEVFNKLVAPDGFLRSAVVAGGDVPGPLIRGKKGDQFRINVIDSLTDPTMPRTTSIHWHGIHQRRTAWADGTAGTTQCPIVPGESFEYMFNVLDQAGTFWYHAHVADQMCDGLRGPLIIYDPADPFRELYDVDDASTIITLADWFHIPSPQLPIDQAAIPNSTLINGRGRYPNGPSVPLSVIRVQQGKRYRMRLINMACEPNYVWTIEGHDMTVIEADGVDTKPHVVDSLQIFDGQRYSFIIHANQPVGSYWIRARPNRAQDTSFANNMHSAILRYEGAPEQDPIDRNRTAQRPLVETDLHPLKEDRRVPGGLFPGGADININMVMGFDNTTFQFNINGAPWASPSVPVLLQMISGARSPQELLPQGSVYELPLNKVIEISIPARPDGTGPGQVPGGPHPFHLHGHDYWVVRSAGNSTYNYIDPVLRDTVDTGTLGSNTTIRFVTDNEGPWLLHCHIDLHLNNGLAAVFAEGNGIVQPLVQTIPQAWSNLCPQWQTLGLPNPDADGEINSTTVFSPLGNGPTRLLNGQSSLSSGLSTPSSGNTPGPTVIQTGQTQDRDERN